MNVYTITHKETHTMSKTASKRNSKGKVAAAPTKEQIIERATAIQTEQNVGFVKALIRARKEFGIVSANVGKPRLSKKAQAALAAEGAAA
jgi:hypothetical protein